MEEHRIEDGNIIIVNNGLKIKPGMGTGEIISNLTTRYNLPPNRTVEIHQSRDSQDYTATVTMGNNSIVQPGFKTLDRAIDWARGQFPDLDITAREVSES